MPMGHCRFVSQVYVPELQAPARFSAAITQNQWYDAWTGLACDAGDGSTKTNVRVIAIDLDQAVANETIEMRIIADDVDQTITQVAVAGTNYDVEVAETPDSTNVFTWGTSAQANGKAFFFEARSLQVMYRKTSAAGANATTVKIVYAQW